MRRRLAWWGCPLLPCVTVVGDSASWTAGKTAPNGPGEVHTFVRTRLTAGHTRHVNKKTFYYVGRHNKKRYNKKRIHCRFRTFPLWSDLSAPHLTWNNGDRTLLQALRNVCTARRHAPPQSQRRTRPTPELNIAREVGHAWCKVKQKGEAER